MCPQVRADRGRDEPDPAAGSAWASASVVPAVAVTSPVFSASSFGLEPRRRRDRPGVLADPGHHARAAEQLEVVGEGHRVAGIGQGAEHLRVGEHLAGVSAGQAEELAQEGGLLDPVQQQDVARQRRLNERVEDVLLPALVARR